MIETFVVKSEDISDLAKRVLQVLKEISTGRAKVVFLEGDLGAGKTTFTKELAALLGIEKEDVLSPTFILKKEYPATNLSFRKLIHIDAYRFGSKEEGKVLRLEDDMSNKDAIIAIEWPDRLGYKNPDIKLSFFVVDDDTREVTLSY
jgi:tRNA threonylcarbamoyladenosine biosynthesis protein TsaE